MQLDFGVTCRDWARDGVYYEHVRRLCRKGLPAEQCTLGAGVTYFLCTTSGERLAVFKPADEERLHPRRKLSRLLAKLAPNGSHALYCLGGRGYKSEVATSVISQELGLDNVPYTRVESVFLDGRERIGCLQVYVREAHETLETLICLERQRRTDERAVLRALASPGVRETVEDLVSPQELEKLCMLEFIVGKLDGNLSNCLVTIGSGRLYSIDHTQALPRRHTLYRGVRLNQRHWLVEPQYMFRLLPGARRRFGAHARKLAVRAAEGRDRLLERLLDERLIEAEQAARMRERISVLERFIRESRTLAELAEVRSELAFARLRDFFRPSSAGARG